METLLVGIIVLILFGFGFIVYFFNQKMKELKNDSALQFLKTDLQGISQQVTGTTKEINDRLNQAARYMQGVERELGKMQEIGRGMKDLQDFLRSPKLRGNVGEQVMRDLLEQMIPKGNFGIQYKFKNGSVVDAVITTKNGVIPIDAKFPLDNYTKAMKVEQQTEREKYLHEFSKDVKKHVTDISKKYILPSEGTLDFALMYIPSEALYYEVICNLELTNYCVRRHVYLVSPNTFYYFLKTILIALEGEKVEERARAVLQTLKTIQHEAIQFGEELEVLGGHVTRSKNTMDKVATRYTALGHRISQAQNLKAPKMPLLEKERTK